MASAIATPIREATRPITSIRASGCLSRLSRTARRPPRGPRRAILFHEEAGRPDGCGVGRCAYYERMATSGLALPEWGPRKLDGGAPWWRLNVFANWAGCLYPTLF